MLEKYLYKQRKVLTIFVLVCSIMFVFGYFYLLNNIDSKKKEKKFEFELNGVK